MKKQIFFIYIVVSLCNIAIAQTTTNTCPPITKTEAQQNQTCQDGKGITTNPSNPVNNECPVLINNFDWKLKQPISNTIIEEVYSVYDADNIYRTIRNPFDDNTNSDYRYLALKQNSNYYPEDGWELLKVDFGTFGNIGLGVNEDPGRNTDITGPRLPYMILYNKYSGTFRFFGSLLGQMDGYETIRIELRIPERSPGANPFDQSTNVYESDLKATNLLSIQGDAVQPLDQETDENVMVVFAKATNNSNKFFWFDIPVAYDPCLCNIRSQLDITFAFVKTASIKLNGTIDGALKTENKNDGTPKGVKVVTTVIAAGVSTVMAVKTGGAVINFQAYSDFVKLFKEIPGLSNEQKDNLDKLSNYVDCGLKFAKVLKGDFKDVSASGSLTESQIKAKYKAANNILDANTTFMSSLANGCNKKDNGATTINATANLSGTWTEEQTIAGTEIKLAVPGSNWDDRKRFIRSHIDTENDQKAIPAYPTYNERLGTFALMETPKFEVNRLDETIIVGDEYGYKSEDKSGLSIFKFSFKEDIKYTFNPKMNINNEKTKVLCRLVIKEFDGSSYANTNLFKIHKINPNPMTDDGEFRTFCEGVELDMQFKNMFTNATPNSKYYIHSIFADINQFKNMPIILKYHTSNPSDLNLLNSNIRENVFIQFKIIANSTDPITNEDKLTYLLFTYPIDLIFNNQIPTPNNLNCTQFETWMQNNYSIQNKEIFETSINTFINEGKDFNSDIVFTSNEVLIYDGIVTISAKLSSSFGKKIKIYSTIGFDLEPGAEISPNIELIVGLPLEKNPQPPQTYAQVSSFCGNNNKYKAQTFSQSAIKREKEEYEARQIREQEAIKHKSMIAFKLSPNPTTANFTISIFNNNEQDYSIALMDVTGKVLFNNSYNGKQTSQHIETNGIAAGIYFVRITCGNTQKTEKLIIQSNY